MLIDTNEIFVRVEGNALVWIEVGTTGPFVGLLTVFVTSLDGISAQKLTY